MKLTPEQSKAASRLYIALMEHVEAIDATEHSPDATHTEVARIVSRRAMALNLLEAEPTVGDDVAFLLEHFATQHTEGEYSFRSMSREECLQALKHTTDSAYWGR